VDNASDLRVTTASHNVSSTALTQSEFDQSRHLLSTADDAAQQRCLDDDEEQSPIRQRASAGAKSSLSPFSSPPFVVPTAIATTPREVAKVVSALSQQRSVGTVANANRDSNISSSMFLTHQPSSSPLRLNCYRSPLLPPPPAAVPISRGFQVNMTSHVDLVAQGNVPTTATGAARIN